MIPQDKIELACQLVYEKVTKECWHDAKFYPSETVTQAGYFKCAKCFAPLTKQDPNPALAHSLDAWAKHIWRKMTDEDIEGYCARLEVLLINEYQGLFYSDIALSFHWPMIIAHPMYHLEAAIDALGLRDKLKG